MIHIKGAPWDKWSKSYVGCRFVAGIGLPIDGICIKDAKYRVRLTNGEWLKEISRCNICENNGETFAGRIGESISAVAIDGGEEYSVAKGPETPNNEICTIKVIKNLFNFDISFTSEKEVLRFMLGPHIISVKLVQTAETLLDGDITLNIENGKLTGYKWNKKYDGKEFEYSMKKATNFTPNEIILKLTSSFEAGMTKGKVSLTYNVYENTLTIESLTQVNTTRAIYGGGFKILITFGEEGKRQLAYALAKFPTLSSAEERKKYISHAKNPVFSLEHFFNERNGKIVFGVAAVITAGILFNAIGAGLALTLLERIVEK